MNKCTRCGKENPPEVHTCTPLALRLADNLARPWTLISDQQKAAAELRRLYEVNAELAEALDNLVCACELPGNHCEVEQALPTAIAALAKAKGESNE